MSQKVRDRIKAISNRIWSDVKSCWIAILLLILYNVIVRSVFGAYCPFLIVTGFPCAGCGMTRAILYILTGRIARGMRLNPAAPFWIAFLIWFFWDRYVCGKTRRGTKAFLAVVCVATLVIYIYRMLTEFPGDPPMVYYKGNLIRRLLALRSGG